MGLRQLLGLKEKVSQMLEDQERSLARLDSERVEREKTIADLTMIEIELRNMMEERR